MKKLVLSVILLCLIGLLMVYSSSCIWAEYKYDNEYYFLIRQALFMVMGFIGMYITSRIDPKKYQKYAFVIFGICFFLLVIVLIPGIGMVRGGARSWIGVGSFSIQPAEFMKLGIAILLSKYLGNYYNDLKKAKNIIYIFLLLGVIFALIMLEPDFGSGFILVLAMIIVLFVAGLPMKWFISIGAVGTAFIVILIIIAPYRLNRILSFLNPWSDPLGSGFQIIQSLYALSPGGIFGLGLFNSRQKFFYLPEPQTDFIFAIIVEELGLIGGSFILFLFAIVIYSGIMISINARDLFSSFLALSITSLLFVQFFVNIGVVIGLLPVTGVTLPFLSYGGSSLVLTLAMVGIVIAIGKRNNEKIDLSNQ